MAALAVLPHTVAGADGGETLWIREPAHSAERLAFVYGGDLFVAGRDGRDIRRVTSDPADESAPAFSPDGRWIAFSSDAAGNADVYIVPVAGGQPRRLTWHPDDDVVCGWTPDGAAVLFMSTRGTYRARLTHLYRVAVAGGLPVRLPMPDAFDGAYSPDGGRIAYQVFGPAWGGASGWRLHRGGTTPPIWIFDFATDQVERVPHDRVNDTNPMWLGDTVYFLSDRNDRFVNLYAYTPGSGEVRQLTDQTDSDISSADAADGSIVYSAGGRLHELDLASGRSRAIPITIAADFPQLEPRWEQADKLVQGAALSSSGVRAAFAARGEIFTVPVDKGDIRNLSDTPGARETDPLWSPAGDRVAFLGDASGEQRLVIVDQLGRSGRREYPLGDPAAYTLHDWSPDGGAVVYSDNHLGLYVLDLDSGARTLIDRHERRWVPSGFDTAVSPDSRWLAYTKVLANQLRAIRLYDLERQTVVELTRGNAEAISPVFSRDGAVLYFAASTNFGPATTWLDMSVQDRPVRFGLYAAVLAADGRSPVAPTSDEENGDEPDEPEDDDAPPATRVDAAGLSDRIVALPVAERNYDSLAVAADGSLFYMDRRQAGSEIEPPGSETAAVDELVRFDFSEREAKTFRGQVAGYVMSADGSHLLYQGPRQSWRVADSTATKGDDDATLGLAAMRVRIEPRAEWRQIFNEVWRLVRDHFYDPDLHGLDWPAVRTRFEPFLDHIARREDLAVLIRDMQAELQVGHIRTGGGDGYSPEAVPVGLLGADLEVVDGRYRIARIYGPGPWNPFLSAPLAAPGVSVGEGDFILAVDGRELTGEDNIFRHLEQTVGRQIVLRVAATAAGRDARDVTVVPTADEAEIRRWEWIEANRRRVDEATGGRVGYVYIPDTAGDGYAYFNRMFFAQVDREAIIFDERSNSGGQVANYIVEVLARRYLSSWKHRDGLMFTSPIGAMFGPKVMLIDSKAGSGGDFLPYAFRLMGLGPLVGTRTWGGLIGTAGHELIDGGVAQIPYFRFFDTDGRWSIENQGVAPDIEVELEPADMIAGRDPQLERAIREILDLLAAAEPIAPAEAPPYPTELGR